MASAIVITSYPNNEIRCRLAPLPRAKPLREEDCAALFSAEAAQQAPGPNLDISAELKTHSHSDLGAIAPASAKLPTKFGTNAKRTLLRVGGVVDRITSDPSECLFLTGTLPGSTPEAYKAMADYAPYLVNSLKAWIAKRVPDKKDFYVWELQERGALHLHYCLVVPEPTVRAYIKDHFKAEWNRLLDSVGRASGVDMFRRFDGSTWAETPEVTQAYAQEVTKSVAAYLSKYCSKYSTKYTSSNSHNGVLKYFPKRWWGCSRPLLKLLREMTTRTVRVGYGVNHLRSIYESLTAELESFSIKGFRYGDKVGEGLNHVYYFLREEWQNVSEYIMSKYDSIRSYRTAEVLPSSRLLVQALQLLETHRPLSVYISANLSKVAGKAGQLALSGASLSPHEAYAIATEIEALVLQYCLHHLFRQNLVNSVLSLCRQVSEAEKNRLEVEEP